MCGRLKVRVAQVDIVFAADERTTLWAVDLKIHVNAASLDSDFRDCDVPVAVRAKCEFDWLDFFRKPLIDVAEPYRMEGVP